MDPFQPYRNRIHIIAAQVTELLTEQAHVQALLDKSSHQSLTHEEMWNAVKQYLIKVLEDSYSLYSNGIPDLAECEFQVEVTYVKFQGHLSGGKTTMYRWYLIGPTEFQSGEHRKKFDVTDDGFYISTRPDPMFCQYLISNKLVQKFVNVG